jgi:protein-S-isoprenylcysteine O-methyltransferase Ste14
MLRLDRHRSALDRMTSSSPIYLMNSSVAVTLIYICWAIFFGFWLLAAFRTKPAAERTGWCGWLAYRLPLVIAIALLVSSFGSPALEITIIPSTPLMHSLSGVLCVIGLLISLWARAILGSNWSSSVTLKQDHELVTRGPYRFVRHPIYTGVLFMLLGSALISGRLGAMAGLPFGFLGLWIKLRQEEALMMRHFPADYPKYKRKSKALLPFVL